MTRIELDQTAFFAEGGGQACDRGYLEQVTADPAAALRYQVVDVQEENEHIYHYVTGLSPINLKAGEPLRGAIDWDYRFDHMQQHSGEHILSGICYAWKGYHNVGFHLGEEITTIDFDGPLTEEELLLLEEKTNQVIWKNEPVRIFYPSAEELEKMDYRSKKELSGDVRIVQMGDTDLCACCAPHVMKTGEVGVVKIVHHMNYKGGVRLSIVCGNRALKDYVFKDRTIRSIAADLSTKPEKVAAILKKQQAEIEERKLFLQTLSQELIRYRLEEMEKQAAEDGGSVVFCEKMLDQTAARSLLNRLCETIDGYGVCLILKEGQPESYAYLSASKKRDCRLISEALKNRFGARGGGSAAMTQGSVSGSFEEIRKALKKAISEG
ncbi:MAG: alanyl-tRNA editing protein [Firmicutes bacterium]|nr:alanyl-tRNA editing protein [Bacillota bacterium]